MMLYSKLTSDLGKFKPFVMNTSAVLEKSIKRSLYSVMSPASFKAFKPEVTGMSMQ